MEAEKYLQRAALARRHADGAPEDVKKKFLLAAEDWEALARSVQGRVVAAKRRGDQ